MGRASSLRADLRVGLRIARGQFRDLLRRNTTTRREKAIVGIAILFVLPFGLGALRQAHLLGSLTRDGVDAPVLAVARNVFGPTLFVIAIFGGLGAAQSLARDSVRPLVLTSASTRAIVLGKVLYLLATWLVPLLLGFLFLLAYALGARAPLFVLAVVGSLLPVLVLTMVVGMSLGYLLWLGVNKLGLSEQLRRVVTASLSVVVFVGSFTIGILIGRAGGSSSAASQLPGGEPLTPIGYYADLFFIGSPAGGAIGVRTVLAASVILGAIPVAFGVLVRLAPAYWYATPPPEEEKTGRTATVTEFERRPSDLIGRRGQGWLARSHTLRVAVAYARRASRSPDQFVYLFYYLFPVVGVLVSLVVDFPAALPIGVGISLAVLGTWFAGGVFCLNPIGGEGTMLTQLVLAAVPAERFVHGRLLAGTAIGLVLAIPGVAVVAWTTDIVGPPALLLGTTLVTCVVLASAALALGLGAVLPKFETIEVFDSVETLAPSRVAGLIHGGLSLLLLAGAAVVTGVGADPELLSAPGRIGAVVGFSLVAGVLTDGCRRYAIARIRDHGQPVVRTDRPFVIYASLGLAVLALIVGQLVSLAAIVVLGVDLSIELLLPVLFVIQYAGYALVAVGFLYVTHRGLSYLDLGVPTGRELAYLVVGLAGSLALWAAGSVAIAELGLPAADHALFEPGEDGDPSFLLVLIPLVLLVNGPVEELLYRNVIQKYLDERFPASVAIVVASALFALVHLPAYATAGLGAVGVTLGLLFVIACLWGAIYRRTESLVVVAGIHGCYNAIQLAGLYLALTL